MVALPEQALYLAIDQGGHASRAMVFDVTGQLVSSGKVDIETRRTEHDRVEHDAESLFRSVTAAIEQAIRPLGGRVNDIRGAGLATQRSSIVCWDRGSGQPLSPVLSWQDRRMADWLEQLRDREAIIHQQTGLVLSPHYGASKMRWCLENLPAVAEARQQGRLALGPLASFLLFRLLAERPLLVDPVNASRTQLWDLESGDWSADLLNWFGVPGDCLPQCVASIHSFGHLLIAGRKIPLTVMTGDQPAALYANGEPDTDGLYINLGTGAFVQRVMGELPVSQSPLLRSVVLKQALTRTYTLEGTVNGAGSALRQIAKQLGLSRQKFEAGLPGWLGQLSDVPLFLNGISGLASPFWVSDFPSVFVGKGEPREKMVSVVESIVFLLQSNIEEIIKHTDSPDHIWASGGLAVLSGMLQRLADLSGIPVRRLPIQEATATGLGFLVSGKSVTWQRNESDEVFEPQRNLPLQQRYEQWSKEMPARMNK